MTALIIFGWILLGLAGLILTLAAVIASLKIHVRASYCKELKIIANVGPLKIDYSDIFDLTPEAEEELIKQSQKHAKKSAEKSKDESETFTHRPTMTEVLKAFRDFWLEFLRYLGVRIKLEEFRLRVLVASPDAAQTALEYGAVCGVAGLIQMAAEGLPRTDPNDVHIDVECDFLAETPELDVELHLSLRMWRFALLVLKFYGPRQEAKKLRRAYKHFKQIEKTERNGNTHGNPNETTD